MSRPKYIELPCPCGCPDATGLETGGVTLIWCATGCITMTFMDRVRILRDRKDMKGVSWKS